MILNPLALGWAVFVLICGILVGIGVGLSAGARNGVLAMLLVWFLLGGIEAAWLFVSDQSLLRGPRPDPSNRGGPDEKKS